MVMRSHYSADLVLNQNVQANEGMYCGPGALHSTLAWALTIASCGASSSRGAGGSGRSRRSARKVLVTMGGSDPENCTAIVIAALADVCRVLR